MSSGGRKSKLSTLLILQIRPSRTFTDNGKREQYLGDESGLIMGEVQRANEDEANDQLTRPHL